MMQTCRQRRQPRGGAGVLLMMLISMLSTEAKLPKFIPRFAFDRDESPVHVPLIINVLLVNLGPDAQPASFRLDTDEFERLLFQLKPDHQPSCVETGEKLHVSYEIFYDVVHVSKSDTTSLGEVLKRNMRHSSGMQHSDSLTGTTSAKAGGEKQGFVPVFDIQVEGEVEEELDRMYKTYRDSRKYGVDMPEDGQGKYGLILLNMDKDALAPANVTNALAMKAQKEGSESMGKAALSYAYRYVYGTASGADSFVSSRRFAVVDLAAGPSTFGNTQQGEGAVIGSSIPRRYFAKWEATEEESRGKSLLRARNLKFQSHLATIVHSAVTHVFAPDIQFDELDFSEKVLVPIIVFQDHRMFDPLTPGHAYSIDVDRIREQLQRIAMPGQLVEVVTGRQNLLEHERIAIALNKAQRSDTVHESYKGRYALRSKHYLDSALLLEELRVSSDYLASGLIAASPVLSSQFFPDFEGDSDLANKQKNSMWALGTRVLPVFLFSLEQPGDPVLFDQTSPFAASKDAVLVIQSGFDSVPVPFFSGGKQIMISLKNPTASVLAGVGAALGGLLPPQTRFSQLQGRSVTSMLWAHGGTPFGPFGNSSAFSQIAIDQVLQNSFASRMDASIDRVNHALLQMDDFAGTYLFDPLGENMETSKRMGWLEQLKKRQEDEDGGAMPLSYATVRELHDEVLVLEDFFSQGAEAMYRLESKQTHTLSDQIFAKASAFHAHAIKTLSHANLHQTVARTRWTFFARTFLVGLIACCMVALVAFLNPRKPAARKKPVVH